MKVERECEVNMLTHQESHNIIMSVYIVAY